MIPATLHARLISIGLALLALLGVLAWAYWPSKPIPEVITAAPEVRQVDGSVVAERAPDAKPPPPRHVLPKGAVEERREQIIVQPDKAGPVEVDLSLIRDGDGRRVVASSPDGKVIRAIDIPIEALNMPKLKPWAAGLSYSNQKTVGLWVERDLGRLRVGIEVDKLQGGKAEARLRVGVSW